ncbi:MAG: hypothetical protein WA110_09475, partial [Anaerolineaceae bacterium]
PGVSITRFAKQLVSDKPAVASQISQPVWLGSLYACAEALVRATDLDALRGLTLQQQWPIPWIEYAHVSIDLPMELGAASQLDQTQLSHLKDFHVSLKNHSEVVAALDRIKGTLPEFYPLYNYLNLAFERLFTTLPEQPLPLSAEAFPRQDQQNIQEAFRVLEQVRVWKENLASGHALPRSKPSAELGQWSVIQEIQDTQHQWKNAILPIFSSIRQKRWSNLVDLPMKEPSLAHLYQAANYLSSLWGEWVKIPTRGIYPELAQELIFLTDKAQENFITYWQQAESSSSRSLAWLVQTHQTFFSSINQTLLQISRHFRTVARSLDVINQPEMARTRLAQNSAGDLMFALVQLEALIQPPSRKPSKIREWQQQYSQILKQDNWQSTVQGIETIESIHPLLPWFNELVRRDVDFFTAPQNQQW